MEQIVIKKATANEAATLSVLGQVTFMETYKDLFKDMDDLINYCQENFTIDSITEGIQNQNEVYLLAYVNESPVGYAKAKLNLKSKRINSGTVSKIERIYIQKEFIGKKIGSQLKEELIKTIKQSKSESVWLLVNPNNDKAVRFYKNSGFSKVGFDTFSVGDNQFVAMKMAKSLN